MAAKVFPDRSEAERIVLPRDALFRREAGDARLYLGAGYALLMQVAHPTVGAGVRDHSTFAEDPWGRLLRTMDYLYLMTHAGDEAIEVGRRVRELHKQIKGTNPDGSHYHSLEPEAYAWVHATLLDATMRTYECFVRRPDPGMAEQMYADYAPIGRLLGIRERDLPPDWASFRSYFDEMVETRLERNETVDKVLVTLRRPAPPPIPFLRPLWPLLKVPPARVIGATTGGLLPEVLRRRFGLEWSRAQDLEFRAIARASRAATRVIPRGMLDIGERHLEWRAEEIAAGPLGPGAAAA